MGSVCNFLKHRLDAAEEEIIAGATSESWSVLNLSGATLSAGSQPLHLRARVRFPPD